MWVDEKWILNVASIGWNDRFWGWNPNRNISLKGDSGLLKEIDVMSRTQGEVRGNMIHLNLEWDSFDPEKWARTSIMFQEKWDREFWEQKSEKIADEKGRNWSIVQPNGFEKADVSKAIAKAVQDVEELLEDVKFSNYPNIAQDIIKMLIGFWDDSLHILSEFEKKSKAS